MRVALDHSPPGVLLTLRLPARPARVWVTGDWHLGHADHESSLFQAHYALARARRWALIHVGDALEMTIPASRVARQGALLDQRLPPEEQRELLIRALRGLRGPIVLLPGNHEFRVDAATGLDFMKMVGDACPRAHVLPTPGIVRLLAGREAYHILLHHGEGPVVSPTTLLDRLQRDTWGVDVIATGHVHASTFDPAIVWTPEGERVVLRLRCGHYLRPPRYAQVRPIARIGAPGSYLLTFHHDRHRVDHQWLG